MTAAVETRHPGITRTRVLLRARYGWPRKSAPFIRTVFHEPDGYRMDAPGFICMAYKIPLNAPHSWGGLTTVTLLSDDWMYEIDQGDLRPGDAMGYLGPDSVDMDGGFIVLFEQWLDNNPAHGTAIVWEHSAAVNPGPDRRAHAVNYKWHAYRFRHIIDE